MRIIDIHTHGFGGFDTRTSHADDIIGMAEAHGRHGVSDIIPTIYPGPVEEMRNNMAAVRAAMHRQQSIIADRAALAPLEGPSSEFPESTPSGPAIIRGVHLEGPFLNPARCGALDRRFFVLPKEQVLLNLIEGFEDVVRIVTLAPELEGSIRLTRIVTDLGIKVNLGHSDASYEEARRAFDAGAAGITHIFNAMRGFHHREPGIAGFGLLNPHIFIEVIADPFHLRPETIDLLFRVKNPEKIIIVSDTVKDSGVLPCRQAITDTEDMLQGGCMTISESAHRLIALGFHAQAITPCIGSNPLSYLE
ncbi:MAG: N-acetylglucosamine-6-phosphate deacetylase [Syntrophorhabdus sp. PtaU1.Bin050]|nr:MAG: N-acetylglucosamine-6-phosphate deacetylase [Syntrophorhabdus sp. PtaU1.Bin050]